ncbi:MAG: CoB--CoM heterodisulfide reductase iron-sulfur subunit B family protein [Promethearchaeota archaeon]
MNEKRLEEIPTKGPFYIFKSCLTNDTYPGIDASTRAILRKLRIGLVDTDDQTCCGGYVYFSSLSGLETMLATVARNFSIIEELTSDVLVLCNACFNTFNHFETVTRENPSLMRRINKILARIDRRYNETIRFWHIAEFIYKIKDKIKENIQVPLNGTRIAIHYGCHYTISCSDVFLDDPKNPMFLDELVESFGATPVHYKEKNLCCGGGWISRYTNRDLSLQVTRRKIDSFIEEDADMILVICPFCLNIYDRAQTELETLELLKSRIPVLHLSQLVALLLGHDPYTTLGIQSHTTSPRPLLEKLGVM